MSSRGGLWRLPAALTWGVVSGLSGRFSGHPSPCPRLRGGEPIAGSASSPGPWSVSCRKFASLPTAARSLARHAGGRWGREPPRLRRWAWRWGPGAPARQRQGRLRRAGNPGRYAPLPAPHFPFPHAHRLGTAMWRPMRLAEQRRARRRRGVCPGNCSSSGSWARGRRQHGLEGTGQGDSTCGQSPGTCHGRALLN